MKWTFKNKEIIALPPAPPPGYNMPVPAPPRQLRALQRLNARWRVLFTPWWEQVLTILFYGPRSQGKSLHQAKTAVEIMGYLDALYLLNPKLPQAIVVSNQKFSIEIEAKYMQPAAQRLYYWENIQQLKHCPRKNCWKVKAGARDEHGRIKSGRHPLHDAYVIIDDAATIIPADGWHDLPRWFRKIWAQAGHNGVHCLANCQDPNSVDINFRRYVDVAFKFRKIIGCRRPEEGKPPIKHIWGIYTSRQIDAEELWRNGDMTEFEIEQQKAQLADMKNEGEISKSTKVVQRFLKKQWKQRYHWISSRVTAIYDTLQNVPEYMPNSYEHIEMKCTDPKCDYIHVRHRVI